MKYMVIEDIDGAVGVLTVPGDEYQNGGDWEVLFEVPIHSILTFSSIRDADDYIEENNLRLYEMGEMKVVPVPPELIMDSILAEMIAV